MPIVDPPPTSGLHPLRGPYDYGAWDTYERGRGQISDIEKELLHRLNNIEQMMAGIYKFVGEAQADREFLRIRNAELERLLSQHSKPELPGG